MVGFLLNSHFGRYREIWAVSFGVWGQGKWCSNERCSLCKWAPKGESISTQAQPWFELGLALCYIWHLYDTGMWYFRASSAEDRISFEIPFRWLSGGFWWPTSVDVFWGKGWEYCDHPMSGGLSPDCTSVPHPICYPLVDCYPFWLVIFTNLLDETTWILAW